MKRKGKTKVVYIEYQYAITNKLSIDDKRLVIHVGGSNFDFSKDKEET